MQFCGEPEVKESVVVSFRPPAFWFFWTAMRHRTSQQADHSSLLSLYSVCSIPHASSKSSLDRVTMMTPLQMSDPCQPFGTWAGCPSWSWQARQPIKSKPWCLPRSWVQKSFRQQDRSSQKWHYPFRTRYFALILEEAATESERDR